MSFTYENQGSITYLVYEVAADESIDSLSLGMLTNNKIPGLAQTVFTQMDTSKYIKFNVSAKVSAAQFFTGAVNKKRLLGVFTGIVDAMLAAEDYMLPAENILLDMNYIFADVSTCDTVLVCLPIDRTGEGRVDLGMFFKNIMFSTQFDQTENCDYVARIINYLNGTPVVSLEDFKNLLDELKGNVAAAPIMTTPVQSVAAQPVVQPVQPAPQVAPTPVAPSQPMLTPSVPTQNKPIQPAIPVPNVPPVPVSVPQGINQPPTEKSSGLFGKLLKKKNPDQEANKSPKTGKSSAAPLPPPPFPGQVPGQAPNVPPMPAKPVKAGKTGKKNATPNFAIPGQAAPVPNFAIPGQPASVPTPPPAPQPAFTPMPQQMNFGETTVLGGGGAIGETTVLGAVNSATQKDNPHLICQKNGEKIPLNKPVFRIGKERSYVDYFIGDNTAISRSHANIVIRDGEYFIVDTNSTNHTYLNGAMIQSNIEIKISHGDKIRFANEDFEFKVR